MTDKPVEQPIVEEKKPISIVETIRKIVRKVREKEKYK
jgi:hypothetical protein